MPRTSHVPYSGDLLEHLFECSSVCPWLKGSLVVPMASDPFIFLHSTCSSYHVATKRKGCSSLPTSRPPSRVCMCFYCQSLDHLALQCSWLVMYTCDKNFGDLVEDLGPFEDVYPTFDPFDIEFNYFERMHPISTPCILAASFFDEYPLQTRVKLNSNNCSVIIDNGAS